MINTQHGMFNDQGEEEAAPEQGVPASAMGRPHPPGGFGTSGRLRAGEAAVTADVGVLGGKFLQGHTSASCGSDQAKLCEGPRSDAMCRPTLRGGAFRRGAAAYVRWLKCYPARSSLLHSHHLIATSLPRSALR